MPKIFFSGKLSPSMKILTQANFALAWVMGNTRDTSAMKQNWKLGYNGSFSDHVFRYDEFGVEHFTKIAIELLDGVDLEGKEVLDVGCGTGIASQIILERKAKRLVSGDLSEYMLGQWQSKAKKLGYDINRVDFRQIDAEALPFNNNSFDIVISSMMLGMIPDKEKVLLEMKRVLRPGGILALSTQGPEHYSPALDCVLRASLKYILYLVGYRIEYWPLKEKNLKCLLSQTGFNNVKTRRSKWPSSFETGNAAFDFAASTSSLWFFSKFPPEKRNKIAKMNRDYFERKKIVQLEQDVIMGYGNIS